MRLPPARATIALVGATVAAYALSSLAGLQDRIVMIAGFVPARIGGVGLAAALPVWLTPLSATLVHAGPLHLLFNMLMLGFCGRYVEVSLGPVGLVVLYVVGAYAAALGEFVAAPNALVPMVGASGAASAVIGAYALLYGARQAKGWGPRSGRMLQVLWLAAAWIGLQLLIDLTGSALPGLPRGSGVAIAAHIGGFLAGVVLARPLLLFRYRNA